MEQEKSLNMQEFHSGGIDEMQPTVAACRETLGPK